MRYAALGLAAVLMSVLALAAVPGEQPYAVHEWGTFTSVSGADGVNLDWRPLSGPPDLPSFVYTSLGKGAKDKDIAPRFDKLFYVAPIRMETPVLYFYSPRDLDVHVKVKFPQGQVTEWYPRAHSIEEGVDWGRIQVRPGSTPEFPREKADSHYYPARETDASPIRATIGGVIQDEKFLFYRGVGRFALPLKITLADDQVTLKNTGKDAVPQAILFERRQGTAGYRILGPVTTEITTSRPRLTLRIDNLVFELQAALVKAGLLEKEARAMIQTWNDSWFEEGLRVIYIVPGPLVDAALPLVLNPRPDTVARVFVGRAELITREKEQEALEIVTSRGADPAAAWKELRKFGRFTQPILIRAGLLTSDPALKEKINRLAWAEPKNP